jgi:hypothetical protein
MGHQGRSVGGPPIGLSWACERFPTSALEHRREPGQVERRSTIAEIGDVSCPKERKKTIA